MDKILGIPAPGLMVGLLIALGLCLAVVAWVAWRRPVIFKLGARNIPRRRAQTTLIAIGLMLSTLIISAALGTGDTLDYSLTKDVYDNYGNVDVLVVQSPQFDAPYIDRSTKIEAGALTIVETALDGNGEVDGIMPLLEEHAPVQNLSKSQTEPDMVVIGIDPERLDEFGGLTATNGASIDFTTVGAGEVVLSEMAAEKLDAVVGDVVAVFYENTPHELTVVGIAEDGYLSGYRRGREDYLEVPGIVMSLAALQDLTGQSGFLSAIAVSGSGGVREGFTHSEGITDALRPALTGTGLGVDTAKSQAVEDGDRIASNFSNVFLILGLFSVMAGILLIVLIFTMLAAERRNEMGISRAVGMQRRQLIQQFVSEGCGYAIVAGVIGSGLGVAASVGIAKGMRLLFGQYAPITPHVESRSVAIAYCLGVFITFITVVLSSWKVSRLNIVAAIRDIPELSVAHRTIRSLLFGVLLLTLGTFMTWSGLGSDSAMLFFTGASLAPIGLAVIARFFGVRSRLVFTLLSLEMLALWLLPKRTGENIWGEMDAGIEIFFVSGVLLVVSATILIMQNTEFLLGILSRLGGIFKSKLPAVRTGVAYPGAARGRTGMTIAMFSLIIFSLVMMASMGKNYAAIYGGDNANGGWDVSAASRDANPITDFVGELEANGVDTAAFAAIGILTNPNPHSSEVRLKDTEMWLKSPVQGMNEAFIDHTAFKFRQRAEGYATDADIVQALRTEPNVAVIDAFTLESEGQEGAFKLTGLDSGSEVFAPITAELAGPDGSAHPIKIIGVIDQDIGILSGLFVNQQTVEAIYPGLTSTVYYVSLADANASEATAKSMEAALFPYGVQSSSIHDELEDAQRENAGFLYLIEGFMGLGLIVGVAAVGVISFRAVVERRQQIGVLRALGYQPGMVSLSFLIETAYVVGLGILSGSALGVVLSRNLFVSDDGAGSDAPFLVPWVEIAIVVVVTVATAMLMTWLPSRQASRVAPAEALRYE